MMNKGEGLLALEQLSQEVLGMAADEHALLCFDANDFRLMRQQELSANAGASRVINENQKIQKQLDDAVSVLVKETEPE